MKRAAAQIADREQRLDVLINNAGALFGRCRLTQDGLERLLASRPARIINTASAAHQDAILDFDDLQSAKNFGAMKAYSCSKLCNILFTRELARRLHGRGVTANCLHPGFVATRFGDQSGGSMSRLFWLLSFLRYRPQKVRKQSSISRPRRTRRRRHATTDLLCCCGSSARHWRQEEKWWSAVLASRGHTD
jgi:NAD(P)-dependent dehydrogenase (short-subunit alcohol dehydrogenase family)